MARRFIDISAPLQNDIPADPPGLGPKIEYIDHQQSLPQILPFFSGLKKRGPAGWAGMGGRTHRAYNSQRHASRRALALPSDNE